MLFNVEHRLEICEITVTERYLTWWCWCSNISDTSHNVKVGILARVRWYIQFKRILTKGFIMGLYIIKLGKKHWTLNGKRFFFKIKII